MLLGLDGQPQKPDKASAFLWSALSDLWAYSANRIPEISDAVVEIDCAMRLGFISRKSSSNGGWLTRGIVTLPKVGETAARAGNAANSDPIAAHR